MDIDRPNRRAFLGAAALASTALAASLPDAAEAHPAPHGDWDMSWIGRVGRAKHKAVFDSPEIDSAMAFMNAFLCLDGYASVYGARDADMGLVVVVRHTALPLVFGDAIWAAMKLGAFAKVKDPLTGEDALRNPFIHVKQGEKTVLFERGAAVDAIMARGVTVLCCNMALRRFADMLAKAANLPAEEAHKQLVAALVPGTILVPSGIFGVIRAQEAGCHYIRST